MLFIKFLAIFLLIFGNLYATEVEYDDFLDWVESDVRIDPPTVGNEINFENLKSVAPWIPPGLFEEINFPDFAFTIQKKTQFDLHPDYVNSSNEFQSEVELGPNGSLLNYTAGQPFSVEDIHNSTSKDAGYKILWNNIHRWQNFGISAPQMTFAYLGSTSGPAPLDKDMKLNGGGSLDRFLTMAWRRVYLSNLPQEKENGYKIKVRDSETRFFKEYMEFLSPFNVSGTKFIVERMSAPNTEDIVNTYLPSERRVRRFSAKERADRFMGSTGTLDDIEGFSGRVLDYTWTLLSEKEIFAISDSIHTFAPAYYGPYSRVPQDNWQLRDTFVVKGESLWDGNPVKTKIIFFDKETFNIPLALQFDSTGKLWKVLQTVHRKPSGENDEAHYVPIFLGMTIIDRLANIATTASSLTKNSYPGITPREVKKVFSVSALNEGQ